MRKAEHRASLFLLELVADLALFTVCAAVCVGLLLRARGMSEESRELTDAVYAAQSIAEEWRATGMRPTWSAPDEHGFAAGFSGDGEVLNIAITKDGRQIFALEGVRYLG